MISKAQRTRNFIINQVAPIFNKKGYSSTSLSDMIAATGLTKGSIYGNFKGKDEVALEAFKYNLNFMNSKVNYKVKTTVGAINKLNAMVDHYESDYQRIFDNGGCSILKTTVESDYLYPQLKQAACRALQNWKKTVEDIIEDGIQNGEVRKIDKEEFSVFFVSFVEGTVFFSKALDNPEYLKMNINFLRKQIEEIKH